MKAEKGLAVSNFIQTRLGHRPTTEGESPCPCSITSRTRAVLADSWMLFCAECSQKMRIIMAAPSHDGREMRTYECVYGHRERVTVALH
jgi:hypothetical protein